MKAVVVPIEDRSASTKASVDKLNFQLQDEKPRVW